MEMSVYVLLHCTSYEGQEFLGAYKYLSQAQEAEYAYNLQFSKQEMAGDWTEIREVILGTAPATGAGKREED